MGEVSSAFWKILTYNAIAVIASSLLSIYITQKCDRFYYFERQQLPERGGLMGAAVVVDSES